MIIFVCAFSSFLPIFNVSVGIEVLMSIIIVFFLNLVFNLFILKIISSESTAYGLYHYSNLGEISWYDFAVEIFRQFKKTVRAVPIPTSAYSTAAKRPAYSVMDLSKAKITFGNTIPLWKQRII